MSVVSDFLGRYQTEQWLFKVAAEKCADLCKKALAENSLRAIVTFRAKDPESLKLKLERKDSQKKFESLDEISESIHDLGGVRIALYFPDDKKEVERIVTTAFNVWKKINHPTTQSSSGAFPGYVADHYHVSLKEDELKGTDKSLAAPKIEIQVASLMMHAWSEVEHDLVYKPSSGDVTDAERDALNQLNGLALASEISLRQLQKGIQQRLKKSDTPFTNHYELGAFLLEEFKELKIDLSVGNDSAMGSVIDLFQFLHTIGKLKPEEIRPFLSTVDVSRGDKTVVEQIIERVIATTPEYVPKASDKTVELDRVPTGSVIKGSLPHLYWYSRIDSKRYVFPNKETFYTWYPKKEKQPDVIEVSDDDLRWITLGGNVTYKPGTRLLKLPHEAAVYAVSRRGVLRKISSDAVAKAIFGEHWRSLVDTIPEAFFVNYSLGMPIFAVSDYDPRIELDNVKNVDHNIF